MAKILVIDQERVLGDLFRAVLGRFGHEVYLATSGRAGLELARQVQPDLALVNWHLPDVDGPTVIEDLGATDPKDRILVVTEKPLTETEETQARQVGVQDVLRKGLSLEVWMGALERVLAREHACEAQGQGDSSRQDRVASTPDQEQQSSLLVVDDEEAIRRLLTEFLTRRGYRVQSAANGEEALALVERAPPHLIVLDLYMPGMNWVEVLKRLRARQYRGAVLVLSASQDEGLLREALELGAVDVVGKPARLDQLLLAIQVGLVLAGS
jgi:DNA-binding response OmpR family regulator